MKLTKTFDYSNKLPRGNASVLFSLCYTWSWSMVTEFEDHWVLLVIRFDPLEDYSFKEES